MLWHTTIYDPATVLNDLDPKNSKEMNKSEVLAEFQFLGKKADLLEKINDWLDQFDLPQLTAFQLSAITCVNSPPKIGSKCSTIKRYIDVRRSVIEKENEKPVETPVETPVDKRIDELRESFEKIITDLKRSR